jgi:hypothetical protein|tara:strand:- start:3411 stop:4007 length:597 start_codon:yes stop_codon:yes gene_type:complete
MKINKKGLDAELGVQFAPILRRRVQAKLIRAAREVESILMKEFDAHPVTREIKEGAGASNISGTLGGYGNLFTYIGFSDSDNPIEIVRALLSNSLNVKMLPPRGKQMIQEAIISLPTKAEIEASTPLPWAAGRSWAKGIEEGISGLGQYLNKQSGDHGRSGGGVQSDEKIRSSGFRSVDYLSGILGNLSKNIQTSFKK